ncbi:MAG: carboxymuconolactone decarboxylase family protein [Chloroflexi bacterium]|nr:carboxymuconolactone decarboxylase family protein [Chloroflexota bacterium]
MARVSYVEKEQAEPLIKEMFQKMEDQKLPILNLFKVMGHCPHIGRNFIRLGNAILKNDELSPKLRELAILRVGSLAGSVYEFTKHVPIGKWAGLSQEQVESISNWTASDKFDDQERAVLAYTDEVASDVKVKDETFNKLKTFLDEKGIVKLTAAIGYYGMVSRILVALQVDLEPGEQLPIFLR